MKRITWALLLILILGLALAACGGGGAAEPPAPTDEATEVVEPAAEDAAAEVESAPEATEAPAEEDAPVEADPAEGTAAEPAADMAATDLVAGLPASGVDADSGLEINPAQVQSGVDYVLRGELVNFSLVPTDKPEFMIESPAGVRYRVQSQALEQVVFTDGTTLEPHLFKRGMLAQATARLMESETATSIMLSNDMVLLAGE